MTALSFFLDSNVIVGYYLSEVHRLSNPSRNVFNSGVKCWWSRRVHDECFGLNEVSGVCGRETYNARKEFRRLLAEFDRGTFSDSSFEHYPIIGEIVRNYSISAKSSADELRLWIEQFKKNLTVVCNLRRKEIDERLNLHIREKSYPAITKLIVSDIQSERIELDESDLEIWLDAHDLCLATNEEITFISDNKKHVSAAAHIITRHTSITAVRELESFRT